MSALKHVTQRQLELAEALYGDATTYARLLKAYTMWAFLNLCQKHYTHDSVFFIINEGIGFKAVKFYNDSNDYRVSGHVETLSDAYNEAFHTL